MLLPEAPLPVQIDPRDWLEVKRVLNNYLPHHEVWAFGSRARRTAKTYSDLDLVVITEQPLSLAMLAAINDAFDTADMSIRVDLVDWASTTESFRKVIAQDRIRVQSATGLADGMFGASGPIGND